MKKIKINEKSDLWKIAEELSPDSELFGDESADFVFKLAEVLRDTKTFGTVFVRVIRSLYGDEFKVISTPSKKQTSWSF